jgi:holliday junction DNA helicase RuvA
MIGWLQGLVRDPWHQANRFGTLLVVADVGYEVQLSRRQFAALPPAGSALALHIHHAIRDDGWLLYGFAQRHERDLFRELVAVSGVGPQVALGLLGELEPRELVRAIIHADLRRLVQAPGVGKRTAERLAVELRTRLQQRFSALVEPGELAAVEHLEAELATPASPEGPCREEVQLTLTALGYEPLEIHRAMRAVASLVLAEGTAAAAGEEPEVWIRECLRWLSRAVV